MHIQRSLVFKNSLQNTFGPCNIHTVWALNKKHDSQPILPDANNLSKVRKRKQPLAIQYLRDLNESSVTEILNDREVSKGEQVDEIREQIEVLKQMKEQMKSEVKDYKHQLKQTNVEDVHENEQDDMYVQKSYMLGTPNEKSELSEVPCGGCGAMLHCLDPAIPGFVPQEVYKTNKLDEIKCRRCMYITWNENQNVVQEVDMNVYKSIFHRIKKNNSLVLMVVDVNDLANSFIPDFLKLIGNRTPLVVVGNKVDLIPKDSKGYLDRILSRMAEECYQANLVAKDNIKHVCLVSAKTGYGIEELVNKLFNFWKNEGNVYLVGVTNSGKSTLFNKLLDSDFCKYTCRDIVQRATVSRLPGTTMNVLGFPNMRARNFYLALRTERLIANREREQALFKKQKDKLKRYGRSDNAVLKGHVGKTEFRSEEEVEKWREKHASTGNSFATYSLDSLTPEADTDINEETEVKPESLLLPRRTILPDEFPDSCWTYDTPGLVNPDLVVNYLTQDELKLVLKQKVIHPRTFVMRPGTTMFITGLARIDYLEGVPNTLFTAHIGMMLPVHVMDTEKADEFYMQTIGTETLGVPLGDADRLQRLSSLCGQQFTVETHDSNTASADLQLSSL
ncbi:hypothetical protein DPMN_160423, partial [Dreissena polymorpha]